MKSPNVIIILALTFDGWKYYNEISRGIIDNNKAFMAIQFKDKGKLGLAEMFNSFKKAVKMTNFDLFRIDDEPQTGSIPDKIIVDILNSQFVIADLTYNNANVYWEAGYAEALKKPVIYTCKENFFEKRPFDIMHKLTIKWNKDNIENTTEQLKATI